MDELSPQAKQQLRSHLSAGIEGLPSVWSSIQAEVETIAAKRRRIANLRLWFAGLFSGAATAQNFSPLRAGLALGSVALFAFALGRFSVSGTGSAQLQVATNQQSSQQSPVQQTISANSGLVLVGNTVERDKQEIRQYREFLERSVKTEMMRNFQGNSQMLRVGGIEIDQSRPEEALRFVSARNNSKSKNK
ncbi:hypothetical protein JNK13_02015 [bacterium]|nr:hypothetical protein [bacterium]